MRVLSTILRIVVLCVLLAVTAHGREMAGKFGITPKLGLDVATGEFLDQRRIGYQQELEIEYFYTNSLSIGLKFLYANFNDDNAPLCPEQVIFNSGDAWPVYGVGTQGKYFLAATPYTDVFGGVGILVAKIENPVSDSRWNWDSSTWNTKQITAPGVSAGTGMSRHLSRLLAVHINIEYNLLFTKGIKLNEDPGYTGYYDCCRDNAQWFAIKLGLTFYLGGAK